VEFEEADPLHSLQLLVECFPATEGRFRFTGGAVGYLSFDAIRYWEKTALSPRKPSMLGARSYPDLRFGLYEQGLVIDHRNRKTFYFSSDRVRENRYAELRQLLQSSRSNSRVDRPEKIQYSQPRPNITREAFESSVVRAKEYIRDGEIFQVVLSKRLDFALVGDPLAFYSTLRVLNPSPYMYYLDLGETKIVGSSPEMLARAESGTVETFPIAGTTVTSPDKVKNAKLACDLLADPKERAEHLMLVDLGRNDVGRVSEYGSVSVPELMKVHQYSHVQHIVSHVTGKMRTGLTSFDAMRSIFPAGTLSGAPKIRAIQILDELEPEARGPYGGAVGYFSFNGDMDSAITIRTMAIIENRASIQAGAGIVADSSPQTEWEETDRKAAALLRALEVSSSDEKSRGGN
jgi:anthranilate synthase component I